MNIRVLGCSGGIGPDRFTTSFMIDNDILLDAGTGVGRLSLDAMVSVRHVFLTHSHLDHICFLPLLIDTIFDQVKEPLIVHGLKETLDALKQYMFNWVLWPDFSELPNAENPVLRFEEMAPGDNVDVNGRKFEMIPVNHIVPAVAYRIECDDKVFVFSGDTSTNDMLWEALNDHPRLDLLIVEAAFAERDKEISELAKHYCPSSLAGDMAKLKHEPSVYITHLKSGEEDLIMAECQSLMPDRKLKRLFGTEMLSL